MKLIPPVTQTVTSVEARARFDDLLANASSTRDHRVVIEDEGEPVAALISFADLERFDLLLRQRQRNLETFRQIAKAFDDATDEELEREAIKAIAEIRAEARAKRQQVATVGQ